MERNPTVLLVDGIHGINAINCLMSEYKNRLYIVESPRGEKLPLTDTSYIDEVITDGDLYARSNTGEFWRVEFNDGDIIAVNPNAEWCDQCDRYELPLDDNITVYQVGAYFLAAIINGDLSGLTDREASQLVTFEGRETDGLKHFHWSYNTDHAQEFDTCEITGMRGNTVELHLVDMDRAA